MQERPLRAGIIGCGTIARSHAAAYTRHPRTVLSALADVRLEAAEQLAAAHGLDPSHCYTDAAAMLAAEALDIVSVCTWPGLHAAMTVMAAEAGVRAVICEKPLATDLAQVDQMLSACDAAGTRLIVSHQHRFNPYCTEARRLLAAGAIGAPLQLYLQTGRGLLNNGSHYADMARYLLGDPPWEWVLAQVQREADRYERGERIEDLSAAIVGFPGGVRVVLETDLPDVQSGAWQVVGAEGILRVSTRSLRYLNSSQAGGWTDVSLPAGPASHVAQVEELIGLLERGSAHRGDAHGHRHTFELLMGIYESARRRALVRPPLPSGPSPLQEMIDDGTLPVRVPGRIDLAI
ncbi:MAG TPA: Gfo/Idh/MocA family oxidoreductase [Limnochordia bacterium]